MIYTVTTERLGAALIGVTVVVLDDDGDVVLRGETSVCVVDEADALAYAEDTFLVDLRRNDHRLAGLVLPIDSRPAEPDPEPEVIPDDGPTNG